MQGPQEQDIKPLKFSKIMQQGFQPLKFADAWEKNMKISLAMNKHRMNVGLPKNPIKVNEQTQIQREKNKQKKSVVENIKDRDNVGEGRGFK